MEVGSTGRASLQVDQGDTAVTFGSGDVDVLATPRLVALCEEAAVAAVAGHLEANRTTVGTRITLDHLAPTPVGGSVEATATLERVDGRTLEFSIRATDAQGAIATGSHVRVVVDRQRFEDAAASRR
ncbi:MAG TPA: hotdog domain-containing protein [Actinomycetota bacterium]|nr:hotdog domain-containing protein [Actinomycetota bacterium]